MRVTGRSRAVACVAAAALLAVAGCSSSSKKVTALPAGASTSAAVSSAAAPTPSPTPTTSTPLSPYENDPAVKALRSWAAHLATLLPAGKETDATLNALMTPAMQKSLDGLVHSEIGRRYPGPIPFTPVGVTDVTATGRTVRACLLTGGFSQDPTTHTTTQRNVIPVEVGLQAVNGVWQLNTFYSSTAFSCSTVTIATPSS